MSNLRIHLSNDVPNVPARCAVGDRLTSVKKETRGESEEGVEGEEATKAKAKGKIRTGGIHANDVACQVGMSLHFPLSHFFFYLFSFIFFLYPSLFPFSPLQFPPLYLF